MVSRLTRSLEGYFEGKESVRNSDAYRQMEVDELMARASSGFSNQSRQSGSGREEEAASPPGVAPALNGLAASSTASALANATAAWASIANGPQGNNAAAAATRALIGTHRRTLNFRSV